MLWIKLKNLLQVNNKNLRVIELLLGFFKNIF